MSNNRRLQVESILVHPIMKYYLVIKIALENFYVEKFL